MFFQLTDAGVALFNASSTPPILTQFKLGSGVNYLPLSTDTALHGSEVFSGAPSAPEIVNGNVVKYVVYLDNSVGDFLFGEEGLYYGSQLIALGANSTSLSKIKVGSTAGNSLRIDAYISLTGTNYQMWADLAESNNQFQVARLNSVDQLPPSSQAVPNMYVINGVDDTQAPSLAYTDRTGLWNLDSYHYGSVLSAPIIGFDSESVTLNLTDFSSDMAPLYFGQIVLEFTAGSLYSICRLVKTAVISGSTVTLGFNTAIVGNPAIGDTIKLLKRYDPTIVLQIPTATASILGGIKIGSGLQMALDGTCSLDTSSIQAVISINGVQGNVILTASNLPGLATVASTGSYTDLINLPPAYSLPIMSTSVRGGAKIGPSGNLTVVGADQLDLNFAPVKAVNGAGPDASGNVTVVPSTIGLINPQALASATNLNTLTTTGLFTVSATVVSSLVNAPESTLPATLEVVPLNISGTGDSVQRWTNASASYWRKSTTGTWSTWQQTATLSPATTTALGVVKIGSGLVVAGDGTLTATGYNLPTASSSVLGGIKLGSGLAIDGAGVVTTTYSLPTASASTLGGIKIGSGLSIDGSGVVTTVSDATKLNVVNGSAQGIALTTANLGTVTSTLSSSLTSGNVQQAVFTGGAVTWTLSGWPTGGKYGEIQFQLTNAGLATHTFPAAVKWVMSDGTLTSSFSTYIADARGGATNLQSSGIDFLIFWSIDGGSNIYAKVL